MRYLLQPTVSLSGCTHCIAIFYLRVCMNPASCLLLGSGTSFLQPQAEKYALHSMALGLEVSSRCLKSVAYYAHKAVRAVCFRQIMYATVFTHLGLAYKHTGLPNKACTWFGELCSCPCLVSRNKLHQTTYKPYSGALYVNTVFGISYYIDHEDA